MFPNVPKRNVFIKLRFLGTTLFQIRKNPKKTFYEKLTCKLKIVFTSTVFSPSRIGYLRCYFQDVLASTSVVSAMLSIMERPNAILKCEFVRI